MARNLRFRIPIFYAGDYPNKHFSITSDELKVAAEKFTPVDIDLDHQHCVMDGQLGKLISITTDGSELIGQVEYPSWLMQILANAVVSTTWDRNTKELIGLSLDSGPPDPVAGRFEALGGPAHLDPIA